MNPQERFDPLERAYETHCARLYGAYLDQLEEGEMLGEIEGALWSALDFDDICNAIAEEGAMDQKAFVDAVQACDSEKVLTLIRIALQADIDRRTDQEYARRERELEIAAEIDAADEIEEAAREWRMR